MNKDFKKILNHVVFLLCVVIPITIVCGTLTSYLLSQPNTITVFFGYALAVGWLYSAFRYAEYEYRNFFLKPETEKTVD